MLLLPGCCSPNPPQPPSSRPSLLLPDPPAISTTSGRALRVILVAVKHPDGSRVPGYFKLEPATPSDIGFKAVEAFEPGPDVWLLAPSLDIEAISRELKDWRATWAELEATQRRGASPTKRVGVR
jgi:hypothetical protein